MQLGRSTALQLYRPVVLEEEVMRCHAEDRTRIAVLTQGVSGKTEEQTREHMATAINAEALLNRIAKEHGLPDPDDYTTGRFAFILARRFPEMTLQEVMLASELLLTGNLDVLMRKHGGQKGEHHFGKLSVNFLIRMIMAYRDYRGTVMIKISKEEEQRQERNRPQYTPEESWALSRPMLMEMIRDCCNDLSTGTHQPLRYCIRYKLLYDTLGGADVFKVHESKIEGLKEQIKEHQKAMQREVRKLNPLGVYEPIFSETDMKKTLAVVSYLEDLTLVGMIPEAIADKLVPETRPKKNST